MRKINFNFLNFCTIYESEGSVNKDLDREYCFSEIFYEGPNKQKNNYILEIYWDKYEDNDDNNCLLTTEQLVEHINEIKKIKSFEHELEKHEDKYVLKFTLDAPRIYHKIILSWLRYSYEWPFNMALYEAFKIKDLYGFKRENLFNLFNVVGASMGYRKHGTDIHAIGEFDMFKKLVSYKEFKALIEKARKDDPKKQINKVVPQVNGKFALIPQDKKIKITNSEFWEDDKGFQERVKVYRKNHKTLKENK